MEPVSDADFFSQTLHCLQCIDCVILPLLTRFKNIRFQFQTEFIRVRLDSLHVFSADVDWLVKNGDGIDFRDGFKRRT